MLCLFFSSRIRHTRFALWTGVQSCALPICLSTPGDLAPSIDAIGNDLHAVLTAVDARDAVLVGHSMGGMTIQSYAALHHEDFVARAKAVVLVATAARVLGRPVPARIIEALMGDQRADWSRSEEHKSELQSLMRNSYAVFCL